MSNNNIKLFFNDVSLDAPIINTRGNGGQFNYIKFGDRNDFPQLCADLVKNSPTQSSIINSLYKRLKGASINMPIVREPNPLYSWSDIVENCLKDYAIYEAFSLQGILSENGVDWLFYHQPVSDVRLGKSEYGVNDINVAYINSNWREQKTSRIKEIKMIGSEVAQKGVPYLFYFKEYNPTELYYHIPSWFSAANWIKTDERIARYYNNFVANNFNGNKHIDFPFIPSEDEKVVLEQNIKESMCGDGNGGEALITYSEGEHRVVVTSLATTDADLYNNVSLLTKLNIVTANELPSPTLAGIAISNGFNNKAEEILAAETNYRLNKVQPMRSFVLKNINKCLKMNGNGDKIITIEDYNQIKEYKGDTVQNDIIEDNGVGNNVQKETEIVTTGKEETNGIN